MFFKVVLTIQYVLHTIPNKNKHYLDGQQCERIVIYISKWQAMHMECSSQGVLHFLASTVVDSGFADMNYEGKSRDRT